MQYVLSGIEGKVLACRRDEFSFAIVLVVADADQRGTFSLFSSSHVLYRTREVVRVVS